jgi:hypothetical protein
MAGALLRGNSANSLQISSTIILEKLPSCPKLVFLRSKPRECNFAELQLLRRHRARRFLAVPRGGVVRPHTALGGTAVLSSASLAARFARVLLALCYCLENVGTVSGA